MRNYALDSNIVSYYLKNNKKIVEKIEIEAKAHKLIIPPMVYFEVKRNLQYLKAKKKITVLEKIYQINSIDTINKETLDIGISIYCAIRENGKIIDDADILIAAFCIQNNYSLVTNNTKHFENIANLEFENWL